MVQFSSWYGDFIGKMCLWGISGWFYSITCTESLKLLIILKRKLRILRIQK
jgi:hypothetical protein